MRYYIGHLDVGAGRLKSSRRSKVLLSRWHFCILIRGYYAAARWI